MTSEQRGFWLTIALLLVCACTFISLYFAGRADGTRSVCRPEHFPSGTVGRAIADCTARGGFPHINGDGKFECTKRVEVPLP